MTVMVRVLAVITVITVITGITQPRQSDDSDGQRLWPPSLPSPLSPVSLSDHDPLILIAPHRVGDAVCVVVQIAQYEVFRQHFRLLG